MKSNDESKNGDNGWHWILAGTQWIDLSCIGEMFGESSALRPMITVFEAT